MTRRDFGAWLGEVTPGWHWEWPYLVHIREQLNKITTGECKRLMLFVPPRHGKSEMVTVRYPVWRLERDPGLRVIIAAYGQLLAEKFSRKARRIAESRPIALAQDRFAVHDWETAAGGGVRAVGVGSGVTGQGGNLIVIDDPVKSREEAESETYRERCWDWYRDDLYTRLEPNGAIILIQCMTGDTPVLMADGTEHPLRDIKVGDHVATYDDGRLGISTVRNHISNGLDYVLRIKTTCGTIVHANERHPFLVEEHGQLKWMRLKNLTMGHRIVTARGSGGNGRERPALSKAVGSLLTAEDTARHTITKRCGLMGIVARRLTRSHTETRTLSIATELPPPSMTRCSQRKGASAQSAISHQERTLPCIGRASCALTTATKLTQSEGFCATTATLPWGISEQKRPRSLLPNISDFTTETIASIEPAGIEEVFDLQIERTENFIANGLVSHNTRWHEDDLAGRILDSEDAKNWTVISLPALAEEGDPLGREVGEALCPARFDADTLRNIQAINARSFYALYQQRPQPDAGTIFQRDWFPRHNAIDRSTARLVIQAWDTAYGEGQESDYTVCVTVGLHPNGIFVLGVWRGRVDYPNLLRAMNAQAQLWRPEVVLVEDRGSGQSAVQTLRAQTALPIIGVPAVKSKVERAQTITGLCEAGRVTIPPTEWGDVLLDELLRFPTAKHDDQVDAFVYAIQRAGNLTAGAVSVLPY